MTTAAQIFKAADRAEQRRRKAQDRAVVATRRDAINAHREQIKAAFAELDNLIAGISMKALLKAAKTEERRVKVRITQALFDLFSRAPIDEPDSRKQKYLHSFEIKPAKITFDHGKPIRSKFLAALKSLDAQHFSVYFDSGMRDVSGPGAEGPDYERHESPSISVTIPRGVSE